MYREREMCIHISISISLSLYIYIYYVICTCSTHVIDHISSAPFSAGSRAVVKFGRAQGSAAARLCPYTPAAGASHARRDRSAGQWV